MSDTGATGELVVANGIDVGTGAYLTPTSTVAQLADLLRGSYDAPSGSRELRRRRQRDEDHLGVVFGRDPQNLASVGWGVVVPADGDPAVLEAIDPLLRLREEQAGDLFQRLEYRPGEEKDDFLARYDMGPGVVDPRRVPYYLLLLGSPEHIPFDVQFQLSVSYAVGRLDLERPEAYAAYAASVISAEHRLDAADQGTSARGRRFHLFATQNPGDKATALSASHLAAPLEQELRSSTGRWQITAGIGAEATRVRLEDLLTGSEAPDVLFTASHGLGGGPTRREVAGALLCQDWPGPLGPRRPIEDGEYLAAHHLPSTAPIGPRIIFSFACFGAGTPAVSDYPDGRDGIALDPQTPFTARLPQRLLGASAGGALAFVGHVDRAWSCSFQWKGLSSQVAPFYSTMLAVMDGIRLGAAMESLTSRYAEIASELTLRMDGLRRYGKRIDDADLVGLWTATHDARAYAVLGDPAVRAAPRGSALPPV